MRVGKFLVLFLQGKKKGNSFLQSALLANAGHCPNFLDYALVVVTVV